MTEYTPMMTQYLSIKKDYQDCLLFFRLGDFYELFFEDAVVASNELNITLTKKNCGKKDGEQIKVDMCGVPFHSADTYIAKLVSKGFKVAICEQTETPKQAIGKIVKRAVTRVITSGTVIDLAMLDESKNNYIMCIFENKVGYSISVCDVSTGEFLAFCHDLDHTKIIDEIGKFNPSEIIANSDFSLKNQVENIFNLKINMYLDFYFNYDNAKNTILNHFNIFSLSSFSLEDKPLAVCSSGALLSYLLETQKNDLSNILKIKFQTSLEFMFLDISSRKNLELTENIREKTKKGSLLWVLDKTKTAIGSRLIRKWIEQPLVNKIEIEKRLDAVSYFKDNIILRQDLNEFLSTIKDIERLMGKISYQTANARDLIALKNSFKYLPDIKNLILNSNVNLFEEISLTFDPLTDLYNLIENSIEDDPPFSIREGDIIKYGYNMQIDNYKVAKNEGANWLLELEQKERELTGIKNLKIKFNKIFGYFIEVTSSNLNLVPERYIRKQTMANCERYVTEELKEIEKTILEADEKVVILEFEEFCKIRDTIKDNMVKIQQTANNIAILDVINSFANVAEANNYCKPQILEDDSNTLEIKLGRHPVVECLSENQFIPNDTFLNTNNDRLAIITGPNMAGKSTYMRQVALITLMAQIGCFVPAYSAKISLVDRIFTRVGASDNLATGESTFMVEMNEVANILNNATKKSLLILDEIGRGTSTFDGLSIAWAVLEYIADEKNVGARSIFSTHYHELTTLENSLQGVKNYFVEIQNDGENLIFLRKVLKGTSKGSYGIHVAKIAGIPKSVINRANEILKILELNENHLSNTSDCKTDNANKDLQYTSSENNSILFLEEITNELNLIDLNKLSPIDAWQKLFDLKTTFSSFN